MAAKSAIDNLVGIMARLRDPEEGCPWDVEQTFETIVPYTIEEAYEVADAIELNTRNYCDLADSIDARIAAGEEIVGVPQKESNATYSIWRDDDDYAIDWSKSAEEIQRLVDAVGSPYLGARCRTSKGHQLIVENVEVVEDVHCEIRDVGKVIFMREGRPTVICGAGMLELTDVWLVTDAGREPFLPMTSFRVRFC